MPDYNALKEARFEEGVPADPTVNMKPEDQATWERMNDEYGDLLKEAEALKQARFEAGVPADPTQNMSPEDAQKWKEMNEEYGDKFKTASAIPLYVAVHLDSYDGPSVIGASINPHGKEARFWMDYAGSMSFSVFQLSNVPEDKVADLIKAGDWAKVNFAGSKKVWTQFKAYIHGPAVSEWGAPPKSPLHPQDGFHVYRYEGREVGWEPANLETRPYTTLEDAVQAAKRSSYPWRVELYEGGKIRKTVAESPNARDHLRMASGKVRQPGASLANWGLPMPRTAHMLANGTLVWQDD